MRRPSSRGRRGPHHLTASKNYRVGLGGLVGFTEARPRFAPSAHRSVPALSMSSTRATRSPCLPRCEHSLAQGLPHRIALPMKEVEIMRALRSLTTLTFVALFSVALAACTSATGKTVGENVDDATITSEVKAQLAAEKVA